MGLNLVLWVGGVALIVLAVFRAQQPWRRLAELDHLAENARRYDGWRGGGRRTAAAPETTGADVMRQILRRRLLIWGAVAAAGGLLVLAGFAIG
jgi:hypothetical protein